MSDTYTLPIEGLIEKYEKELAYAVRTPWKGPTFTDNDAWIARDRAKRSCDNARQAYAQAQRNGQRIDDTQRDYHAALDLERRADALYLGRDAYVIRKPLTYLSRTLSVLARWWATV
jgi:hypothetical protein